MVTFRILGPLEVEGAEGRTVPLTATKPRTLLALLLLHANRPVGVSTLTDALWPLKPPRTAAGALRTHVSSLRTSLGLTGLTARPPGYQLQVDPYDLDVLLFDRLAGEGHRAAARGDLAGAADRWERALGLWRGRPLDGLELGAAAESTLADIAERRLTLLEHWAQARLTLGEHAGTLPALAAAAAEQPLRERLHELAMLALYRSGRQAEALETFRQLRRRLVADLGVEPGQALQRLQRQILSADPALDPPGEPGAVRAGPPAPRQLPPDIAAFTGRHREVTTARARLAISPLRPAPLVAISGPGGVGKSALAVYLAHRLAHRFPDGQLYVDLQGATAGLRPLPPLEVLGRFLRALGARDSDITTVDEASAAFRAVAAGRRLLVLLDNAQDAEQVRPLLPAGPHTAVLLTSRPILSTLDNAAHLHLDVLSPVDAMLLLSRLAGADRVAADPGGAQRVATWCGCLPLALRIAGARLAARPSWPVRELAERLSDTRRRLDELSIGELGVRSSFQVSYELLHDGAEADDRAAARAFPLIALPDAADLSVPAAAALLDLPPAAAERILDRLVDSQLLACPAPGRFRLHDLLRLFGRSLATSDTGALVRLLRWYSATAWQAYRRLRPADGRPATAGEWAEGGTSFSDVDGALDWLESERANLLAAVHQVAETPALPAAAATSLARALFAFFHVRGYLNDWVEVNEVARAVARRAGDPIAEAHANRDLGAAFEVRGEYQKALGCLREALDRYAAAGDRAGEAACLNGLGTVYDSLGRLAEAAEALERSLAIVRGQGDRHAQAISLNNLGDVYCGLGSYDRAAASLREALAIFRDNGNRRSQAAALNNLAQVHEREGRYPEAQACYEESYAMFVDLGVSIGQATVLAQLGRVHRLRGRHGEALERLGTALELAEKIDERRSAAVCLRELGTTHAELGDPAAARAAWVRALAVFEALGVREADEVRADLATAGAGNATGITHLAPRATPGG
ncbi:BTAD domain-containing putative transcriptional regulator [Phytohabitans sp. ZYX-F-186]|uniref:BTAD domain-containing putative transcriptional regulator n=1 Tax=Phytohabitans maris TaxID=3071409 RepID=A0ABU0ZB08_9ACTN|nr:BTAD domain-containing putative transcriptional regulator [Phytohabitans sp. ZYX-F-186]MDQ7904245.1 BTAD domain-containing putative transcriptional regulator [Phytohabitans sp. ZYX-F-186]